ncbi:MAG: crotonase/enoyl-CoA hydratase family protein [Pseudomonadota bacterium]
MFETIRLETDARGVATLTLNRPDKHNAMSAQMIAELTSACADLAGDRAVRAVVLAANGRSFCAGGDLGWMRDQMEADAAARQEQAGALAGMLGAFNRLPQFTIAAVSGNAFGGGLGLISVCDMAIAAEDVQFALSETRLGLIPATIGPYVQARTGAGPARRIFLHSRPFDTDEAQRLSLIARAVPAEDLAQAVEAEIAALLACAPGAVAQAKALIRELRAPVDAAQITRSVEALTRRWESEEASAGIAAFFDRKPPPWAP